MLGYNEQYVRAIINEGVPSTDINLVRSKYFIF
jgi:hypothetical protein